MLIVFGSLCMDFFLEVDKHPTDQTPVTTTMFETHPGGRGGNQALAALRMGPKTAVVGMVGDDPIGKKLSDKLRMEGVIASGIGKSDKPTGTNSVAIDAAQSMRIYQAMGANSDATAEQIPDEILNEAAFVLLQMELPEEENYKLMQRAKENGAKIMLNLAPMKMIPRKFLSMIDYLVVNQHEAKQIAIATEMDRRNNAVIIASGLAKEGNLTCIVTLGEKGSVAVTADGQSWGVPALTLDEKPKAKELWGASDSYCGTLAACLYNNMPIEQAIRYAAVAGSLACKKAGAQSSYAYLDDIEAALKDFPQANPAT